MSAVNEVASILAESPGRTSGAIRDELRVRGRVSVTTADVARILMSAPSRFRHDSGDPVAWWETSTDMHRDAPALAPVPEDGPLCDRPLHDRPLYDRPLHDWPLYDWQREALDAWRKQGGRGVVEAVTGTGKTMVGVAAAAEELARGGQVCVLVPTTELLLQWRDVLRGVLPSSTVVGLLGAGHRDRLDRSDVLVAVVNSARVGDLRPRRPGGLLVGDECHRYGSAANRLALGSAFVRRLGLSATYARSDEGHVTWLDPYFGGTCFRMGYRRAIADGVTAHFTAALAGVAFTACERGSYDDLCLEMSATRAQLIGRHLVPAEPPGAFFEAVGALARRGDDAGSVVARQFLRAMQERRALLAETPAKADALARMLPAVRAAQRTLVFTQSIVAAERAADALRAGGVRAAAIHSGLDPAERRVSLARFADGDLQAVAAPQVLDEGVDVPAADLAVILASSRSRRQMIQRMGRVLRRKNDGRLARFVVVFVEGTVEDPAKGAHDTFLEEVTDAADAVRTFPSTSSSNDLCTFAATTGTQNAQLDVQWIPVRNTE